MTVRTGRPVWLIDEIIAGKRPITPEIAKDLGAALGTSREYSMNLERVGGRYRAF
jgi:HTH-type transcriptional regulator/antitoxin HigA